MKVLIINDFGSSYGGAERFIENMLGEIRLPETTFYRINIVDIVQDIRPVGYLRTKIRQLTVDSTLMRTLDARIKEIDPDVIHLNSNNLYTNSVAKCLLQFRGKVVCFIHDYYALKRLSLRLYARFSGHFIYLTHSPDVYRLLVIQDRVAHLVKVPFNHDKWLCVENSNERNFVSDLLYVGRIEKEKGIYKLVQAVELVKLKIPSIQLTIIGDGSQRRQIEKLIEAKNLKHHIRILGIQPDQEILKYYNSSRILVFPSPEETLGYVALEAQACGIPIVAFNNKSVTRWCHDHNHGFLVKGSSASNLADKVVEIFDNKELLQRVSSTARKSILEERYNASQCEIGDVYTSIMSC